MVVPIERVCRSEKLKKYVGNNLLLNITHNKITLAVTGNNCTIRIDENSGWIKVVGDNCDVTVLKGSANIDYVGNFGKIHLGSGVAEETVTYIGNEGEISTVKEAANTNTSGDKRPSKTTNVRGESKKGSVTITNSNRMTICTSCIPSNFSISIPHIRIGRKKGQESRERN